MAIAYRLFIPIVISLGVAPVGAAPNARESADGPCVAEPAHTAAYRYVVTGRARPLLVWTNRRDVGAAHIGRVTDATAWQQISLVVGTDPERAPMGMNRWGYTVESRCGGRTNIVGLMTQSDEATIGEATVSLAASGSSRSYRAIRSTVDGPTAQTETLRVSAPSQRTYKDASSLLEALPARGATRTVALPSGSSAGFLFAVASALNHAASSADHAVTRASYVYGLHAYDLTATVTDRVSNVNVAGRSYTKAVNVDFVVRNRTTQEKTMFQITAGAAGDLMGVPIRVVYRPRWWLELELLLAGDRS